MNIDLGRARMLRNVDYVMGTFWFCLGAYLAYTGYPTIACFYMCMGPFIVFNAWMDYSFKSLSKDTWDLINDLEAHNKHLKEIINNLEIPGHDDYEGGYVE